MAATIQRTNRQATPERWQAALARALDKGVQVRQVAGTGQWIATSATDPTTAYVIDVTGTVAHGCGCTAGEFGDPVCCHRAAFYHAAGLLDLDPEPEPPAPAAPAPAPLPCGPCDGRGWQRVQGASGAWFRLACQRCDGSGLDPTGEGDGEPRREDEAPYDVDPRPCPAALPPGRVACAGCGRVGIPLQDKPVRPGWMCPRCRPVPAPVVAPIDLAAAASLLAA